MLGRDKVDGGRHLLVERQPHARAAGAVQEDRGLPGTLAAVGDAHVADVDPLRLGVEEPGSRHGCRALGHRASSRRRSRRSGARSYSTSWSKPSSRRREHDGSSRHRRIRRPGTDGMADGREPGARGLRARRTGRRPRAPASVRRRAHVRGGRRPRRFRRRLGRRDHASRCDRRSGGAPRRGGSGVRPRPGCRRGGYELVGPPGHARDGRAPRRPRRGSCRRAGVGRRSEGGSGDPHDHARRRRRGRDRAGARRSSRC